MAVNQDSTGSEQQLTKFELISVISTGGLSIFLLILAGFIGRRFNSPENGQLGLSLAVTVGALGGLAHEIAQSGGKIMFFAKKADGFYLGSLAGMVLGAVAGLLVARVLFSDPKVGITAAQLSYEAFIGGLGLKGVVEAAGGQPVSQTNSTAQPSAPNPPLLPAPPANVPQV